jgi:hypothetical protein
MDTGDRVQWQSIRFGKQNGIVVAFSGNGLVATVDTGDDTTHVLTAVLKPYRPPRPRKAVAQNDAS